MIDTAKLIPRSKPSSLSKDSITNLTLIKKDAIEIDSLLKQRLVLSKVREGIIRQQEERKKRMERETLLEERGKKRKKRDDNLDPLKSKKPKSGGGVIGFLLNSVLSNFSGIVLAKVGTLLKIGKLFKVLLSPKLLVIAGTIAIITKVITTVGETRNVVKEKDLNAVKGKKVEKNIDGFLRALNVLVASFAVGAVGARISRGRAKRLAELRGAAETRQELFRIGREEKAAKEAAEKARVKSEKAAARAEKKRQREVAQLKRDLKRNDKRIASDESIRTIGRMFGIPEEEIEAGLEANRRAFAEQFAEDAMKGRDAGRKIPKVQRKTKSSEYLGVSAADEEVFRRLRLDPSLGRRGADPRQIRKEQIIFNENLLARDIGLDIERDRIDFEQTQIDRAIAEADEFKGVDERTGRLIRERKARKRNKNAKSFEQIKAEIDLKNPTYRGASGGRLPLKPGMATLGDQPRFQAPKITAKSLKGNRGLRKVIGQTVGQIPFLGDIIFMLLDIFVFGEPPVRAAFMAVGGALLGFLGGLLGSLAGPVGTVALGILGGMGGDMLGGLLYDMLLGQRKVSRPQPRKSFLKRAFIKVQELFKLSSGGFASYGKYMLGEQGREFVLDADSTAAVEKNYPGFLMALNKADYDGALDVLKSRAFYEDGGSGTERMMPVPIPIPSPSNEYARSNSFMPSRRNSNLNLTYSQLYRRG